jgi:hypothetical protein
MAFKIVNDIIGFMKKKSRWIRISLSILSIAVFALFSIPNSKASENIAMVSMFEPDEGIMVPVIQRMTAPKDSLKSFLINFVLYNYYYYGFPFFAPSALVTLPFQWSNQVDNLPLLMGSLRQLISVLPMILALLLLVYTYDRFKTYRSILVFLFLTMVPAVMRNGFWWHPDGIVLLLTVIVLYLLYTDHHQLGWRFLVAAAFCGVLTATKLVGAYFFLAVGLAIIWAVVNKDVTWKKVLWKSLIFLGIMGGSIIIANPFLLLKAHRIAYFTTFRKQTALLSEGYGITYERGLLAAWPTMRMYYGQAIFLVATLGLSIWNIFRKEKRFLSALVVAWFIPLTVSILTFSHFKFQYWLPAAIPLFAGWGLLLPSNKDEFKAQRTRQVIKILLLVIIFVQLVLFGVQSTRMLIERTHRVDNNPEIAFYNQAMRQLEPLGSQPVYAYYDYRLYMPGKTNWTIETSFDLLDYAFIKAHNFDIMFLLQQRINDYLHPSAVAVDPEAFARAKIFYNDADAGALEGYSLLYRNDTALLYIREDVCQGYYDSSTCQ